MKKSVFSKDNVGVEKDGFVVLNINDVHVDLTINSRREMARKNEGDHFVGDKEFDLSLVAHQEEYGEAFIQAPSVMRATVPAEVIEGSEAKTEPKEVWTVVYGYRRVLRCKDVLANTLQKFKVRQASKTADLYHRMVENARENVQRQNLRPWELAEHLFNMQTAGGDETSKKSPKEIADDIGLSAKYVANLIRVKTKLCPELWEMFRSAGESIPVNALIRISKLDPKEQIEAFKKEQGAGFAEAGDEDGGNGKKKGGGGVGWKTLKGQELAEIRSHVKRKGIFDSNNVLQKKGSPYFEAFVLALDIALKDMKFFFPEELVEEKGGEIKPASAE